jgi:hypothetical protein
MSRPKLDSGTPGMSKKRKRGDLKAAVKHKPKRYYANSSRIEDLEKMVAEMVKRALSLSKTSFLRVHC